MPCWVASDKQEYAARTIRGKITGKLPTYLVEFPAVVAHPYPLPGELQPVNWEEAYASLQVDTSIGPVSWAVPGTEAGLNVLEEFCRKRLASYSSKRNDPNEDGLSNLSPWLHFGKVWAYFRKCWIFEMDVLLGQVSAQRAALRVRDAKSARNKASVEAFIEEVVVRRELADNFCFHNKSYDSITGAPKWAQETLKLHEGDEREKIYSEKEFEGAKTHDPLWNAAQVRNSTASCDS